MFKKSILFTITAFFGASIEASLQLLSKENSHILVAGYIRENSITYFPSDLVRSVVIYFDADENYEKTVIACYQQQYDYQKLQSRLACYLFVVPPGISYNKSLLESVIGKCKFLTKSHKLVYVKKYTAKGSMLYIGQYIYVGEYGFRFYDKNGIKLNLPKHEYTFLDQVLNFCYNQPTYQYFLQMPRKRGNTIIQAAEIVSGKIVYKKYILDLTSQDIRLKLTPKRLLIFWERLANFFLS